MSAAADPFPLYYPAGASPAFVDEGYVRRLGRSCLIEPDSRVLVIGAAQSPLAERLVHEFGCTVVVAASSEELDAARSRVSSAGLEDRISIKHVAPRSLPYEDEEFQAIFVGLRTPFPLGEAVLSLRRFLSPKGRLCVAYPVRVGRQVHPAAQKFWTQRLGEPLRLPRECLQVIERAGYEPQIIEALEDPLLDAFYREVEEHLRVAASDPHAELLREELALHRSQGGRSTVSFAVMVGRRKEPGEKPPIARSE